MTFCYDPKGKLHLLCTGSAFGSTHCGFSVTSVTGPPYSIALRGGSKGVTVNPRVCHGQHLL